MSDEHLYIVVYDIRDPKRWRRVFRLMKGFGDWVQLSVFQCRLTRMRHTELRSRLNEEILHGEDHALIIDIGPAERVNPKVLSLGQGYEPPTREPVIV